ncbi:MAG: hypothetical protein M3N18_03600 [Actinomycetota bacterium]|nr:hypothetical protein [Actinomycetota bacterium]
MSESDWTYESKHTILKASPDLRERFRAAMRAKLEDENNGAPAGEDEVEQMAAFAWSLRAQEVCAKTDALLKEGVPAHEVRRLAKVEDPDDL